MKELLSAIISGNDKRAFLAYLGEQTSFTMPEGTMAYYERWAQGPYELRPLEDGAKRRVSVL